MMLTRTQLIFSLTWWYVKVCQGDWVQISHTLSKPKMEAVTKPTVIRRFSTTTTTTEATTLATTQSTTTESLFNNSSFNSQLNRRTNTANFFLDEGIQHSKPSNEHNFGFATYIENVQDTLMKRSHKTFKNKVDILTDLKNNLLFNIKDNINSLWAAKAENREAREYHEKEEESHMDFPSNEGALMTIGFLTFAVFLIKLVLKLITALKQKQNGTATTTTVAPTVLFGRKKRDLDEESIKILSMIEEFKFQ